MTPFEVGLAGLGALLVLLFWGVPVGITMGIVGFVGFAAISGLQPALGMIRIVPFSTFSSYTLSVIPLFILMGNFAYHGGLSGDLYNTARQFLGRMRGGLAMSTVAACAAFAACSGSSIATAATMGKIALPEMKRYGYDDTLRLGCVAAGGTIGVLIPPSVILILYGICTSESIGKLFMAGFIPGILQALFYIVTIYLICRLNPDKGPAGPKTTWRQKLGSLRSSWAMLLVFLFIIVGIYFGIFSAIEAAGIGAFVAFVFGVARRRLRWPQILASLRDTTQTTGMIFLIIIGANIFGYFLALSRLPAGLAEFMTGLPVSRYLILFIVFVMYLFLGAIMDEIAMVLITVPIFYPVMVGLGFDSVWFGIFIVRVSQLGMILPPVGMNLFVIQGLVPDVPTRTSIRGVTPFVIADILHVGLLCAFPMMALFLVTVL